ncbi:MAG: nucleotidyltransferase domain-containing protein [Nitrospiraceae bacterium]|nr:MAG: nucleotidyltransferase domain-containing protein [Nitrospiraceae bacterium]
MIKEEIADIIIPIIKSHSEIKLAYLFGSQADGDPGALSDFDFAFYVDEKDSKTLHDLKFILMNEISRTLKTDRVDILMLNLTDSPELKYKIIKDGRLLYSEEPFRVLIEPRILNEYFDFHATLSSYQLTKS